MDGLDLDPIRCNDVTGVRHRVFTGENKPDSRSNTSGWIATPIQVMDQSNP